MNTEYNITQLEFLHLGWVEIVLKQAVAALPQSVNDHLDHLLSINLSSLFYVKTNQQDPEASERRHALTDNLQEYAALISVNKIKKALIKDTYLTYFLMGKQSQDVSKKCFYLSTDSAHIAQLIHDIKDDKPVDVSTYGALRAFCYDHELDSLRRALGMIIPFNEKHCLVDIITP